MRCKSYLSSLFLRYVNPLESRLEVFFHPKSKSISDLIMTVVHQTGTLATVLIHTTFAYLNRCVTLWVASNAALGTTATSLLVYMYECMHVYMHVCGIVSGYSSIVYDLEWSDQVSETQIKTSCDRNVPKMSLVDQKWMGPWYGPLSVRIVLLI